MWRKSRPKILFKISRILWYMKHRYFKKQFRPHWHRTRPLPLYSVWMQVIVETMTCRRVFSLVADVAVIILRLTDNLWSILLPSYMFSGRNLIGNYWLRKRTLGNWNIKDFFKFKTTEVCNYNHSRYEEHIPLSYDTLPGPKYETVSSQGDCML